MKKSKAPPPLQKASQDAEFNITDSLTLEVDMGEKGKAQVGGGGMHMGAKGPSKGATPGAKEKEVDQGAMPEALIDAPQREKYRFEDLKMGEVIGEGSQAKVRKVKHVPTKQLMALKIISFGKDMTRKVLQAELSRCAGDIDNHPNLVQSVEAFFKEGYLMVLMEYMSCGTLNSVMSKARKQSMEIPEEVLSRMTADMLQGLNHLHTGHGLIHRDLKPSNMLVNGEGVLKISDFGVATFLSDKQKMAFTAVGSTAYMSPERVRGEGYTTACDIWAIGVSVAELAIGYFPIGAVKGQNAQLFELCSIIAEEKATVEWPDKITSGAAPSDELKDFVSACMIQKPDDRPSAVQLLEHPFIKKHKDGTTDMRAWCRAACKKT